MPRLILWAARGFGVGLVPVAPGTFGSLLGVVWAGLLWQTGNFAFYLAGVAAGLGLSVWVCGAAERLLHQKDPGSVVLDEIAAVPICFLPFVLVPAWRGEPWPSLDSFMTLRGWGITALVFVLFRVFDILKPWPVRGSQALPGGWGVTLDDVLAAVYVAILVLPLAW